MIGKYNRGIALRRSIWLASGLALVGQAPAAADTRYQVRASGGLGIENDPFLVQTDNEDDGGAVLAAELQVEPSLFIEDERTTFRLFANARLRQFFEDYDTTGSFALGANGATRLDERTSLSGGAQFQTSRSAAQEALFFNDQELVTPEPGELPEVQFIDPTVTGTRERFTTYGVNAAVSRQLSPRDSASVGIAFNESHTSGAFARDYRAADLTLGYGRQLNERTTLRGTVGVTKSDFVGREAGDAISVTPLVGVQQQISERLNWSAQVGLSFTSITNPFGEDQSATTLALAVSGCRRDLRGSLCIAAQRQPRPTTFDGLSNSTAVNVSYNTALSRRDSIGLNASYRASDRLTTDPALGTPVEGSDQFIGVGANFRRAFTDDLSGFARGSYSRILWDDLNEREANVAVYIGLSYVFGNRR